MSGQCSTKSMCAICKKIEFKYTCPRCNVQYCSKDCYKSTEHSACSESFFRDWFVQEMKERKVTAGEQERIMSMLQKVEEENPIEDFLENECAAPLEERLQDLNIDSLDEKDTEKLWDLLTLEEKEQFSISVKSGNLYRTSEIPLNQAWEPWWCEKDSLVEDVNEPLHSRNKNIPKTIVFPQLSALLPNAKEPSPFLAFNLLNTLYPYVLFQRLYNGCGVSEFTDSFADCCLEASMYLCKNQTFSDAEEALVSAMNTAVEICKKEDIDVNQETLIEALKDVGQLLTGPSFNKTHVYVCSALSDLHNVYCTCRKTLKKKQAQEDKRKRLFGVMKKLEFLVSWSSEQMDTFPLLAIESLEIYKKKKAELATHMQLRKTTSRKETKQQHKPLIEEI